MSYLKGSVLMLFIMSLGLSAGMAENVKKDDMIYKSLKMSVESKLCDKGSDKLSFTVKVAGKGIGDIYLFNGTKNLKIKPLVKGDMATITFDVEKSLIEKSRLHFAYPDGSMCPDAFLLQDLPVTMVK